LGFAVPINTARKAVSDVLKFGRILVPWMGIAYTEVTEELARASDLSPNQGLVVGSVSPDSPAANAGIKRGDILIQANDIPLKGSGQLQELIRQSTVGQKITFVLLRNGSRKTVMVTLEEMPREMAVGG
jgi:serine protease Do